MSPELKNTSNSLFELKTHDDNNPVESERKALSESGTLSLSTVDINTFTERTLFMEQNKRFILNLKSYMQHLEVTNNIMSF